MTMKPLVWCYPSNAMQASLIAQKQSVFVLPICSFKGMCQSPLKDIWTKHVKMSMVHLLSE